jgi:hypothetical protein
MLNRNFFLKKTDRFCYIFFLIVFFSTEYTAFSDNVNLANCNQDNYSKRKALGLFLRRHIFPEQNPIFKDYFHQVGFFYGPSTGNGSPITGQFSKMFFENLHLFNFMYSQKSKFFNIHTRLNAEGYVIQGFHVNNFHNNGAGLTQELIFGNKIYTTLGGGFAYRWRKSSRVNSYFTFVLVSTVGRRFGSWNVEVLFKHFSNGGLERPNTGDNFAGIVIRKNFCHKISCGL